MQCTKPIRLHGKVGTQKGEHFNMRYPDGLLVPCGKCLSCRKKKSHEWSMRCLHELSQFEDNVFVTLTYKDEYLPEYGSLRKSHLQKYFKRLRRRLDDRKIRYFACGEYGDKYKRPHYHAIIFGLGLRPEDTELIKACWPQGLVHFGQAEPASLRYVAQYVNKKFDGKLAEEVYDNNHLERVFKLASLGIGRGFADGHRDQILQQLMVTVRGVKMSVPRYYVERLGLPKQLLAVKAIESEQSLVGEIIGVADLTRDQAYKCLSVHEVIKLEDTITDRTRNRANHLQAKVDQTKYRL